MTRSKYVSAIVSALCAIVLLISPIAVGAKKAASTEHTGYVRGKDDGCFHPADPLKRAEIAQIIYSFTSSAPTDGSASFTDVQNGSWYYDAVISLSSAGILRGYADGGFKPEKSLTRAELVHILAALSERSFSADTSFSDVPRSHWAYDSIAVAEKCGWVVGTGGLFRPDDTVTRAEAVTIINRYLGRTADKTAVESELPAHLFPDVSPDDWFFSDVMEASVPHLASRGAEVWLGLSLPEGFVANFGRLRLIRGGTFVKEAESGELGGVSYVCDDDGAVTVLNGALILDDFSLLVANGKEIVADGLHDTADGLYCIDGGKIVTDDFRATMYFAADGRYTSGNETIDEYVDAVLKAETDDSMDKFAKLRAMYDYIYNNVDYRANNNHVPRGADPSEWAEEYMLRLIDTGKGNCYCYAAEMYYFARRVGFGTSSAVSGGVSSDDDDHGWATVEIDGETFLLDPELDTSSGPYPGSVFLVTYKEAPFRYIHD